LASIRPFLQNLDEDTTSPIVACRMKDVVHTLLTLLSRWNIEIQLVSLAILLEIFCVSSQATIKYLVPDILPEILRLLIFFYEPEDVVRIDEEGEDDEEDEEIVIEITKRIKVKNVLMKATASQEQARAMRHGLRRILKLTKRLISCTYFKAVISEFALSFKENSK